MLHQLMREQIEMHKKHRSQYQELKNELNGELRKYDDVASLWAIFDLMDECALHINDLDRRIEFGENIISK